MTTSGTIAISGAAGLVGGALVRDLAATGAPVILRLTRSGAVGDGSAVPWDPATGRFDAARLEGCEAVVHLAGEPIASGRWTASRKDSIRRSRVEGTRLLVDGLRGLERRPRVLVCASAIGAYGSRGDTLLDEAAGPGDDFLARVVKEWEAEAARASEAGIRVVSLRIGVVLAKEGGALRKMLPPFRLGLGGRLGPGSQWMSWIHVEDLVGIVRFVIDRQEVAGTVNAVAPEPVTNAAFTATLARALRRPAFLPAPAFALKLAIGEMAEALLLSSQRVVPKRLLALGYPFRHPRLDGALAQILG